ncbi:MAG: type II toxin-antitoxin system VapC family toxin [Gemmatimonadota bacterium]
MVINTSAVLAILFGEAPADDLLDALEANPVVRLSAASLVEAGLVAQRRTGDEGEAGLDRLLHRLAVEIVPVTREHAEIARAAYRRFGKGRHPAGLNFGDCFSYALASALGEALLFVGGDFTRTDVDAADY